MMKSWGGGGGRGVRTAYAKKRIREWVKVDAFLKIKKEEKDGGPRPLVVDKRGSERGGGFGGRTGKVSDTESGQKSV